MDTATKKHYASVGSSGAPDVFFELNSSTGVVTVDVNGTNTVGAPDSVSKVSFTSGGATSITVSSNDTVYLFNSGSTQFGSFVWQSSWTSGGGSGGQPLSNTDPVISNVVFSKMTNPASDSDVFITFDWDENDGTFSTYKVLKKRFSDGVILTSQSQGVSGSSNTGQTLYPVDTNILSNVADRDQLWLVSDDSPFHIVDGIGGNNSTYTHRLIDWSVGQVGGVKSVIAKFYGLNTGFTADHRIEAGSTIGNTAVHNGSELTLSFQFKPNTLYRIMKATGSTTWEVYGQYKTGGKVSRNFW